MIGRLREKGLATNLLVIGLDWAGLGLDGIGAAYLLRYIPYSVIRWAFLGSAGTVAGGEYRYI